MIRELYCRADCNQAVLVLECASTAEAQESLGRLPYVREGRIVFDLIPLRAYPVFRACLARRRKMVRMIAGLFLSRNFNPTATLRVHSPQS